MTTARLHILRTYFIVLLAFVASISISVHGQNKQLHIFYTNDSHSRIEPYVTSSASPGLGGYVRRNTFMKKMRATYPDLLLFDSGDFWQGTPYFNIFYGEVSMLLMQDAGYDAAALGNHEFDLGMDNMKRQFEKVDFPILSANYDFSNTVLRDVIKPYVVLERKGLKIGVFGLTPNPDGLIQKSNYEGAVYSNPITTAQKMVTLLHDQKKCDLVVCLSHLGLYTDKKLAAATRGIDIILGGHSHTYMLEPEYVKNLDGKLIPISQMGSLGRSIGEMTLTFQVKQ